LSKYRPAIKDNLPAILKLAGIFIVLGAIAGLLRGNGILLGAVAGLLLYGLVFGVGWLASLLPRD
jgi:hypothetical protein